MGQIREWFIEKNLFGRDASVARYGTLTIIKETEKAAYVSVIAADGDFTKWIPKSVICSKEEYEAEKEAIDKKINNAYENGKKRYEQLLDFAKSNNVKGVRVGLTRQTIISKIKEMNIEIPTSLVW